MHQGRGCLALTVFSEQCFQAAHPGACFVFLQDVQSCAAARQGGRGSRSGCLAMLQLLALAVAVPLGV